jgi:hypothetical protein
MGGSRTRGLRTERAPRPPRSGNDMTEQTEYYELDVGEAEERRRDPVRQPRSRARTRWPRRRPIAIIAALAVGIALGAVGAWRRSGMPPPTGPDARWSS